MMLRIWPSYAAFHVLSRIALTAQASPQDARPLHSMLLVRLVQVGPGASAAAWTPGEREPAVRGSNLAR